MAEKRSFKRRGGDRGPKTSDVGGKAIKEMLAARNRLRGTPAVPPEILAKIKAQLAPPAPVAPATASAPLPVLRLEGTPGSLGGVPRVIPAASTAAPASSAVIAPAVVAPAPVIPPLPKLTAEEQALIQKLEDLQQTYEKSDRGWDAYQTYVAAHNNALTNTKGVKKESQELVAGHVPVPPMPLNNKSAVRDEHGHFLVQKVEVGKDGTIELIRTDPPKDPPVSVTIGAMASPGDTYPKSTTPDPASPSPTAADVLAAMMARPTPFSMADARLHIRDGRLVNPDSRVSKGPASIGSPKAASTTSPPSAPSPAVAPTAPTAPAAGDPAASFSWDTPSDPALAAVADLEAERTKRELRDNFRQAVGESIAAGNTDSVAAFVGAHPNLKADLGGDEAYFKAIAEALATQPDAALGQVFIENAITNPTNLAALRVAMGTTVPPTDPRLKVWFPAPKPFTNEEVRNFYIAFNKIIDDPAEQKKLIAQSGLHLAEGALQYVEDNAAKTSTTAVKAAWERTAQKIKAAIDAFADSTPATLVGAPAGPDQAAIDAFIASIRGASPDVQRDLIQRGNLDVINATIAYINAKIGDPSLHTDVRDSWLALRTTIEAGLRPPAMVTPAGKGMLGALSTINEGIQKSWVGKFLKWYGEKPMWVRVGLSSLIAGGVALATGGAGMVVFAAMIRGAGTATGAWLGQQTFPNSFWARLAMTAVFGGVGYAVSTAYANQLLENAAHTAKVADAAAAAKTSAISSAAAAKSAAFPHFLQGYGLDTPPQIRAAIGGLTLDIDEFLGRGPLPPWLAQDALMADKLLDQADFALAQGNLKLSQHYFAQADRLFEQTEMATDRLFPTSPGIGRAASALSTPPYIPEPGGYGTPVSALETFSPSPFDPSYALPYPGYHPIGVESVANKLGLWGSLTEEVLLQPSYVSDSLADAGINLNDMRFRETFAHAVHSVLADPTNSHLLDLLSPDVEISRMDDHFRSLVRPDDLFTGKTIEQSWENLFSNQEFMEKLADTIDTDKYRSIQSALNADIFSGR